MSVRCARLLFAACAVLGCDEVPSLERGRTALAAGDLAHAKAQADGLIARGGDDDSAGRHLLEEIALEKIRRARSLEGALEVWISVRWVTPAVRARAVERVTTLTLEGFAGGTVAEGVRNRLPNESRTRFERELLADCLRRGGYECEYMYGPSREWVSSIRRQVERQEAAKARIPEIDRLVRQAVGVDDQTERRRLFEQALATATGPTNDIWWEFPNPRRLDADSAAVECFDRGDHTCVIAALLLRPSELNFHEPVLVQLEPVELLEVLVGPSDPLVAEFRSIVRRIPDPGTPKHNRLRALLPRLERRFQSWRAEREARARPSGR